MDEHIYTNLSEALRERFLTEKMRHKASALPGVTYLLSGPLDPNIPAIEYKSAVIVCFPEHKILVLNGDVRKQEEFEDYVLDLKDSLSFLSRSKDYDSLLGNIRIWGKQLITDIPEADPALIDEYYERADLSGDYNSIKRVELITSLLTASYNNVSGISLETPANLLDAVKNKIMLFDTDQSHFLFDDDHRQKRVVIQGMAGTGKTELLLHKLKNAYVGDKGSKICFTCFNKVLLSKLKKRIPAFFDIMRVSEQIAWGERLFAMSSWGSAGDKESGLYSYICSAFDFPFQTWQDVKSVDALWSNVLQMLKNRGAVNPLFDYIFVDEGQDFPDSFFDVCDIIAAKKVIVGLDVFQDIFIHRKSDSSLNPTFHLKRCYRTDPRTLMFAHALCLGSLDPRPLNYLSDQELDRCGYKHSVNRNTRKLVLSRDPLKRFFKSEENIRPIEMLPYNGGLDGAIEKTMGIIKELQKEFPNIQSRDICIVFLDRFLEVSLWMDRLGFRIQEQIGWDVNSAVNTKIVDDKVFITNRNNVKGLEFPFVVLITSSNIGSAAPSLRNSLYMALTRSFLRSYLLIDECESKDIFDRYEPCIQQLNNDGVLEIPYLNGDEVERIRANLDSLLNKDRSFERAVREACDRAGLTPEGASDVIEFCKQHFPDSDDSILLEKAIKYIELLRSAK